MRRSPLVAAAVVLLLAGVTTLLWSVLDWPPPRLILRYGFPSAGGPTGRTKTIAGMEFVEVAPGYCHVERLVWKEEGDLAGRILRPFGIPWGRPAVRGPGYVDRWIEQDRAIWITRRPRPTFGSSRPPDLELGAALRWDPARGRWSRS